MNSRRLYKVEFRLLKRTSVWPAHYLLSMVIAVKISSPTIDASHLRDCLNMSSAQDHSIISILCDVVESGSIVLLALSVSVSFLFNYAKTLNGLLCCT